MSAAERTARLQAEGGQGRDAWWGPYGAVDGLLRPTITGGAAQALAPGWQEALSLPQLGQGPFVCHPNRVGSDWPAPGTAPPLVLLTPLFPKSCQPCWVPPRGRPPMECLAVGPWGAALAWQALLLGGTRNPRAPLGHAI